MNWVNYLVIRKVNTLFLKRIEKFSLKRENTKTKWRESYPKQWRKMKVQRIWFSVKINHKSKIDMEIIERFFYLEWFLSLRGKINLGQILFFLFKDSLFQYTEWKTNRFDFWEFNENSWFQALSKKNVLFWRLFYLMFILFGDP